MAKYTISSQMDQNRDFEKNGQKYFWPHKW